MVKAIKEIEPGIKVGGPATSDSKWIGSFMAYCRDNKLPFDFVSTHQYAGDPLGGIDADEDKEADTPSPIVDAVKQMQGYIETFPDGDMLHALRCLMPDKSELAELDAETFKRSAKKLRELVGDIPVFITEWNVNAIFACVTRAYRLLKLCGIAESPPSYTKPKERSTVLRSRSIMKQSGKVLNEE